MKEFLENKIIKSLLISSLVLDLSLFLFFLFFITQSNIPIVLHYNVGWGVDYFGEIKSIFILPFAGLIIFLLNGFLALKLWIRMKILTYFLISTILISEVFLWLAGISLYIINS